MNLPLSREDYVQSAVDLLAGADMKVGSTSTTITKPIGSEGCCAVRATKPSAYSMTILTL